MIFGLLLKNFGRLTKTALYVSRRVFRRKKLSNKNHFSPTFCELVLMIFRILAKNVAKITKAAFYMSRLTFCQKTFLEKKKSTLAVFQGKNLRISAGKCLEEISEGTISAKKGISNHLLSLGEKVSNFSPKVLIRAVRTAFNVSKGWILGKKLEVYSSLIFSDTAQYFWDFMPRVFCRIINYSFYSTKGSFWEKFLFEICASHSRISSGNWWAFLQKTFR